MQLVLNLEKESVDDLTKAISILEKVIFNKQHDLFFADGLDAFQPKPAVPNWLMAEEKKRQDSVRTVIEEKQRQQQESMRAPLSRPQSATAAVDESKLTSAAAQKLLEQKRMMETVDLSILLKRK